MKIINIIIGFLFNVKLSRASIWFNPYKGEWDYMKIKRIDIVLSWFKLMPISKHKKIIEINNYDWQQALNNAYGYDGLCSVEKGKRELKSK